MNLTNTRNLAWQDEALCAQTDPEAFFPDKGESTREAKGVCMACPVRGECLQYALANNEQHGIFGGLSERERRAVKKTTITGPADVREAYTTRHVEAWEKQRAAGESWEEIAEWSGYAPSTVRHRVVELRRARRLAEAVEAA